MAFKLDSRWIKTSWVDSFFLPLNRNLKTCVNINKSKEEKRRVESERFSCSGDFELNDSHELKNYMYVKSLARETLIVT